MEKIYFVTEEHCTQKQRSRATQYVFLTGYMCKEKNSSRLAWFNQQSKSSSIMFQRHISTHNSSRKAKKIVSLSAVFLLYPKITRWCVGINVFLFHIFSLTDSFLFSMPVFLFFLSFLCKSCILFSLRLSPLLPGLY